MGRAPNGQRIIPPPRKKRAERIDIDNAGIRNRYKVAFAPCRRAVEMADAFPRFGRPLGHVDKPGGFAARRIGRAPRLFH